MLGIAAKLERRRIIKRTSRDRADAKGVKFGRKPLTPHQQRKARQRIEEGETQRSIARNPIDGGPIKAMVSIDELKTHLHNELSAYSSASTVSDHRSVYTAHTSDIQLAAYQACLKTLVGGLPEDWGCGRPSGIFAFNL
jgi:hypothetical protein